MTFKTQLCVLTILITTAVGAVPQLINFQGHIESGNAPFDGTGAFKFALVNEEGSETYWSNDGTSEFGSEPTGAVPLAVANGLYNVILGDTSLTNMNSLTAAAFEFDALYLRVWFDDGLNGFQQLTPDQRLTAQGYALRAATADDAVSVGGQTYSATWETDIGNMRAAAANDFHNLGGTDLVNDADADPTNELNSSLTLNSSTLVLVDGSKNTVQTDLAPLTEGLGDGHSLDSSDGSLENVVFVEPDGSVSMSLLNAVPGNGWTGSVAIPDNGGDGCPGTGTFAEAEVTVANAPIITEVEIEISIDHDWVQDLDIWLVSPQGTEVCLSSDNGLNGNDYLHTRFDDNALMPISEGDAPFTGRYQPESPLSALDGEDPNGVWSLRVLDDDPSITGDLTMFHVILGDAPYPIASDLNVSGGVAAESVTTTQLNVPGDQLEIDGALTVHGLIRSLEDGFRFPDGSIQTTAAKGDGHSLDALDGSPTNAVYVDSNGNVGVGTYLPNNKLTVAGSIESIAGGFVFPDGTVQNTAAEHHSLDAEDGSPEDVVFVDSTGNVGVGTTSPEAKLHVNGAIRIPSVAGTIENTDGRAVLETWWKSGFGDYTAINSGYDWNTGYEPFSVVAGANGIFFTRGDASNNAYATTLLYMDTDGDMGIGGTPGSYKLFCNGSAAKPGGGSWTSSSDERLKENILPLDGRDALDTLSKLQGVTYNWINPEEHSDREMAGITAQNLEEVFPDWVEETEPTGADVDLIPEGEKSKAITFPHDFNAYLIEAIKELDSKNQELDTENQELKRVIKNLVKRIERLEK